MKAPVFYSQFIAAFILVIVTGCIKNNTNNNNDYEFEYETIVTTTPVNLRTINSSYDDYNSALPYTYYGPGITFSTNRNSQGENFDLIFRVLEGTYHQRDDVFNFSYSGRNDLDDEYAIVNATVSPSNELGPTYHYGNGNSYLIFADDSLGHFDIKYIATQGRDLTDVNIKHSMSFLNSEFDDYYPTITNTEEKVYFCSNREEDIFNIYSSNFINEMIDPTNDEIHETNIEVSTIFSSPGNDKCPSVSGSLMLFTSDRPGGYGGYDLYYSRLVANGTWTVPVNMGEQINTTADEYRPIVVGGAGNGETVIVFSSDREGGEGGFDLYAARYLFQ